MTTENIIVSAAPRLSVDQTIEMPRLPLAKTRAGRFARGYLPFTVDRFIRKARKSGDRRIVVKLADPEIRSEDYTELSEQVYKQGYTAHVYRLEPTPGSKFRRLVRRVTDKPFLMKLAGNAVNIKMPDITAGRLDGKIIDAGIQQAQGLAALVEEAINSRRR